MESSVYMGNGWFSCVAMLLIITDMCLERVPMEWSVYMGNGCFLACYDGADDHRCGSRAAASGIGYIFIRNRYWSRIRGYR